MNETASRRRKVITGVEQLRHRAGAPRPPRRPARRSSAGHQANASCSWSGVTRGAGREPGLADQQHHLAGQQHQRLDPHAARPRPTTPRAARASACRPGSRRPRPSRRRPAPSAPPTRPATPRAGRPASGRRRRARRHSADRLRAPSVRDQPQRPAHRLELEREPRRRRRRKSTSRAASPSWLGEPRRRSASSARSAACVSLRSGSNGSERHDDVHLIGIPRAARENASRDRHTTHGTGEERP